MWKFHVKTRTFCTFSTYTHVLPVFIHASCVDCMQWLCDTCCWFTVQISCCLSPLKGLWLWWKDGVVWSIRGGGVGVSECRFWALQVESCLQSVQEPQVWATVYPNAGYVWRFWISACPSWDSAGWSSERTLRAFPAFVFFHCSLRNGFDFSFFLNLAH